MQTVTNNPLLVRENVSLNSETGISGSTLSRHFTVFNLGQKEAEVNISVTANNEQSEPVQSWCSLEPNPVILDPGDSKEVTLTFNIPQQASPNVYKYEVLFEAPEQYPNSFFRCVQELSVACLEQEPEWGEAPQIEVSPTSTSNKPYCIRPEEKLNITIKVKNRSYLVDSFELSCPDLESQWYTVQYPERDLGIPGLVTNTDGLRLNPDKEGEISLTIHPPSLTLAGDYVRTIQLTSKNRSNLVLLNVLYLRINSDDRLKGNLSPEIKTLPQEVGKFDVEVANLGNLVRELDLQIEDGSGMFSYSLEKKQIRLPPGETDSLFLIAKPRWFMNWRRPLWGEGLRAKFNLVADNTNDIVLPETKKPPAIPRSLSSGTLILSPRPRWQLITLILLAAGTVGGLIFGIYWWVFRLPPAPRIREFDVVKTTKKNDTEAVLLNWRVKNPEHLDKIGIISKSGGDSEVDETFNNFESCTQDDLKNCIPQELTKFCRPDGRDIECNKVIANVAEPGKYTFELQLFPRKAKKLFRQRDPSKTIDKEISESLTIDPPPTPQFSPNKGLVANKSTYKIPTPEAVKLEWEVDRYSQLKKLDIIGQSQSDKVNVYSYVFSNQTGDLTALDPQQRNDSLRCSRTGKDIQTCSWAIPANDLEAEDYTFTVEAFDSLNSKQPSDTIEAKNTVAVELKPLPEIKRFATEENAVIKNESIAFSWEIKNPQQIDNIAVKAVAKDNSSTLLEQYDYPIEVEKLCSTKTNNNVLRCSSVSSADLPPGDYRFQLLIESQLKQVEKITEQTDTIAIKPQPFTIEYFTIDGERIENGETYLYPKQENIPTKVDIGWSVVGNPNVKIELVPLGEQTEMNGSVPYYLEGDRERIALQVVNELGEQQVQTVQIQPYESNSPRQSSTRESGSIELPPPPVSPTQPIPELPNVSEETLPATDTEVTVPPTQLPDDSDISPIELNPLEIAPKAN